MLEEPARVVAIESGVLLVETQTKSACTSCNVRSGCGQQVLSSIAGNMHQIRVLPGRFALSEFTIGEQVVLGMPEQGMVSQMVVSYLVPLFVMFLLASLVSIFANTEGIVIFAAIVGLLVGGYLSQRLNKHKKLQLCHPEVVNKASDNETVIAINID